MGKYVDLTGQKFGRLIVIKRDGKNKKERLYGCANVIVENLRKRALIH